jgi:hypothetical protein
MTWLLLSLVTAWLTDVRRSGAAEPPLTFALTTCTRVRSIR